MTDHVSNRVHHHSGELPYPLKAFVDAGRRIVGTLATNWRRRKMIEALEGLDDRMLEDIGLSRNDIPRIVDTELLMATITRQRI